MKITENTTVNLVVVGALLGAMISVGVAWAKIERLDSFEKLVRSVDSRLSRIEGRLGIEAKEGE